MSKLECAIWKIVTVSVFLLMAWAMAPAAKAGSYVIPSGSCVISYTTKTLLFQQCPAADVAERMDCKIEAISAYARQYAVCVDPKTKDVVYFAEVVRIEAA